MTIKNATPKTTEQGITRFKIDGKRWFQKSAGNTYHSCVMSALVGDEWVTLGKVDFEYGYDDGYTQTGVDWLIENGYLDETPKHDNGNASHYGWPFRKDNNIDTNVIDVNRKADL